MGYGIGVVRLRLSEALRPVGEHERIEHASIALVEKNPDA
jgi:hypothetical protein